jgi:hypothetical protein
MREEIIEIAKGLESLEMIKEAYKTETEKDILKLIKESDAGQYIIKGVYRLRCYCDNNGVDTKTTQKNKVNKEGYYESVKRQANTLAIILASLKNTHKVCENCSLEPSIHNNIEIGLLHSILSDLKLGVEIYEGEWDYMYEHWDRINKIKNNLVLNKK